MYHTIPTKRSARYAYWRPNAGAHLLPEAGATQERTLEAVGWTPWLGVPPARTPSGPPRIPWCLGTAQDLGDQRTCDLGNVTQIRPATPTKDIEPGQLRSDRGILLAQFHRIAGIQRR